MTSGSGVVPRSLRRPWPTPPGDDLVLRRLTRGRTEAAVTASLTRMVGRGKQSSGLGPTCGPPGKEARLRESSKSSPGELRRGRSERLEKEGRSQARVWTSGPQGGGTLGSWLEVSSTDALVRLLPFGTVDPPGSGDRRTWEMARSHSRTGKMWQDVSEDNSVTKLVVHDSRGPPCPKTKEHPHVLLIAVIARGGRQKIV